MNKIFKIIWNHSTQTFQVVSELAKRSGKAKTLVDKRVLPVAVAVLMAGVAVPEVAADQLTGSQYTKVQDQNHPNNLAMKVDAYSVHIGPGSSLKVGGTNLKPVIARYATAVGGRSYAKANATALGTEAKADAGHSVAIGQGATTTASQSTAVGQGASATAQWASSFGSTAKAEGKLSTAVGFGANSKGDNSTVIGWGTSTEDAVWAVSVGNGASVTAKNAVAVGGGAKSKSANATAIGPNSDATVEGSVALGNSSKTANGVSTDKATVGALSYTGFKGEIAASVVSVGSDKFKRQIQNVAAGQITETSTDAINGSQLYSVLTNYNRTATTMKNILGGNADLNPNGSLSFSNIGETGKGSIHEAVLAATTIVKEGKNTKVTSKKNDKGQNEYTVNAWNTTVSEEPNSLIRVTAETPDTTEMTRNYKVNVLTTTISPTTSNGIISRPTNNYLVKAHDVVDAINNVSWFVTSGITTGGTNTGAGDARVQAGNTVKFIAGNNIDIAQSGREFTFSTKNILMSFQNDGNAINNGSNINAQGLTFNFIDGIKGKVDGSTVTVSLDKDTLANDDRFKGPQGEKGVPGRNGTNGKDGAPGPQGPAGPKGDRGEKGDPGSAGAPGKAGAPGRDGADGKDGISPTVSVVDNSDGSHTITITDKTGDKKVTVKNGERGEKGVPGDRGVDGKTPTIKVTEGENGTHKIIINDGNGKETETIVRDGADGRTTGHKVATDNDSEQVENATNTAGVTVNPDDTITYKAGKNLVVNQDNHNITFGLAKDIDVSTVNATTINVPTGNGNNVTINGNGINAGNKPITNVASTLDETSNSDGMGNGVHTDGKEGPKNVTTISSNAATVGDVLNAGWNLEINGDKGDFVKPYDAVNFANGKGTNINFKTNGGKSSTIKVDIATGEIKPQGNGALLGDQDAGKYDQAKKALDDAKQELETANQGTDNKAKEAAKAKVDAAQKEFDEVNNNIATVENVVSAVNKSGFMLKASAGIGGERDKASTGKDTGELINPGDAVEMVAGKNLKVTHTDEGKITYETKENVTFTSVQFGDNNGPKIQADGTNIKVGDKDGAATKITNVANGEGDKDAVNISQLKANTTKVVKGTNIAGVEKVASDDNVGVTYKINADGTKVSHAEGSFVTVTPSEKDVTTNVTTYTVGLTKGEVDANTQTGAVTLKNNSDGVATAQNVANAIAKSGWKLTDGTNNAIVNPGDSVSFVNGNNTKAVVTATNPNAPTVSFNVETTDLSASNNGNVTTINNGDKLVNATTVANVINGIGHKVATADDDAQVETGENTTGELIKSGEMVTFKAGKNLVVNQTSKVIAFGLSKDIDVGTVNATTVNATTINVPTGNGNNVTINDNGINAGNKNISNVADGTENHHAVNIKQLKANTTTVVGGDNIAGVETSKTADGITYTINAEGTKVKHTDGSFVTVSAGEKDTDSNITTYTVDVTKGTIDEATGGKLTEPTTDGLATVKNVATAINSVSWELHNGTGKVDDVKAGDKVRFVAGNSGLTTVSVDKAGDTNTITVDVTKGNFGTLPTATPSTTNTGALSSVANGQDGVATVSEVTTAINSAFWRVKLDGDNGSEQAVKAGDLVEFAAGENVNIVQNGKKFTISATQPDASTTDLTVSNNGNITTPVTDGNKLVNATTVAKAINESGHNIAIDNNDGQVEAGKDKADKLIKSGEKVTYKAGKNLVVRRDDSNITFGLAKDIDVGTVNATTVNATTINVPTGNGNNVTINDNGINAGNKNISNVADGTENHHAVNIKQLKANTTTVLGGDNIAGVETSKTADGITYTINANGTAVTAAADSLVTVSASEKDTDSNITTYTVDVTKGTIGEATGGKLTVPDTDGLATVKDVAKAINSVAWELYDANKKVDDVKAGDKVKFVAGDSGLTTVTVTSDTDNTNTIKFDVTKGDFGTMPNANNPSATNTGALSTNGVTSGVADVNSVITAINSAFWRVKSSADGGSNTGGAEKAVKAGDLVEFVAGGNVKIVQEGTKFTISTEKADTSTSEVTINNGKADEPTGDNGSKLVNVTTVVKALNNVSYKVATDSDNEQVTNLNNTTGVDIKAGDKLTYKVGKNLVVNQDNHNITFGLAKDINVNSTTTKTLTVPAGANNNIVINESGISAGNKAITNVAGNLPNTYNKGDTTSGEHTDGANLPDNISTLINNAATVGDVLNAGWNLGVNGDKKDFVKPYDTVNLVHGKGTLINVDVVGNVSTVTFDVDLGKLTPIENPVGDEKKGQVKGSDLKAAQTAIDKAQEALDKANEGSDEAAKQNAATALKQAKKALEDLNNKVATVENVADAINKSGFTLKASAGTGGTRDDTSSGNKDDGELINPGDTIEMVAGKNLTVKHDKEGKITYSTNENVEFTSVKFGAAGPKIENAEGHVKVSAPNGDAVKITNVANGTAPNDVVNLSQLNATKVDVAAGSNIAGVVATTNKDTGGTTYTVHANGTAVDVSGDLLSVAKTAEASANNGNVTTYTITLNKGSVTANETTGAVTSSGDSNAVATAQDVANAITKSGWKLGGKNANNQDIANTIINPGDSLSFINGNNTKAVIDISGANGPTVTFNAVTSDLTVTDGKVADVTTDGDKLVNATTVAKVINGSGWHVTVDHDNDSTFTDKQGATKTLVKSGDTATFKSGKNLKVKQDGQNITFATKDEVEFTSVQFGNGGPKIQADAGAIKVGDANGGAVKITNVANGTIDANSKDAINGSQLHNIVTNSFWGLHEKGVEKAKIRAGDKVNFVDGNGISVTITPNAATNTSEIKYDIKLADNSLKVDANGLAANTTTLTENTTKPGSIAVPTGDDASKLVNASTVAEAINKAGHKVATADNEDLIETSDVNADGVLVKPGDKQTFTAGKNLKVKQDGTDITFALAKDIEVNKVTTTELKAGPVTINNNGIDAGNKNISNVADGTEEHHAVNLKQLKAAKSSVEKGTNIAGIETKNNADGSTTYVINANGTAVTVEGGLLGLKKVDASKDNGNVTTYTIGLNKGNLTVDEDTGVASSTDNTDMVATTKQVADAINNSGWKLNGNNGKTDVSTLVKPGKQVTFKGEDAAKVITEVDKDGNATIKVKVDAKTITDAVKGNITVEGDKAKTTDQDDEKFATTSDVVNAINESGHKVATADTDEELATSTVDADGTLVKPGDKQTFTAGKNLEVKQDGANVTFAVSNDLDVGSVNVGEKGEPGKDGQPGKPGKDGKVAVNGKDGSSVVINGKDGSIGLTGPKGKDGKDGVSANIKLGVGEPGVDGKDGKPQKPRIEYTYENGNNKVTEKVATLNDGMKFVGNDNNVIEKKLNETLGIVGGIGLKEDKTPTKAVSNINTHVSNKNGSLNIEIATTPEFEGVDLKNGDNVVHLTPSADNSLHLGGGSTNAPVTISNVKEGVKGTDAVNVNQLNRKMGDVNNRINKVNKDLQAGIAGAAAMAFLQRPNLPGKSMVSAAVGGYKGQSAIAVGYARNSDNNKISIKVGVGLNSRKDVTYGGSVGYQW